MTEKNTSDEPVVIRAGRPEDPYLSPNLKSQHLRRIADIVDIGESLRNGQAGTGQDREKLNKILSKELDDYLSIIGG